jgi:hypothetical protein
VGEGQTVFGEGGLRQPLAGALARLRVEAALGTPIAVDARLGAEENLGVEVLGALVASAHIAWDGRRTKSQHDEREQSARGTSPNQPAGPSERFLHGNTS